MDEKSLETMTQAISGWQGFLGKLETLVISSPLEDNAFFLLTASPTLEKTWQEWLEQQAPQCYILHLEQSQAPQDFLQALQSESIYVLAIAGLEKRSDPQGVLIKLAQLKAKTCPQKSFTWLIGVNPDIAPIFRDMQTFLGGKTGWLELTLAIADLENTIQDLLQQFWLDPEQWFQSTLSTDLTPHLEQLIPLLQEHFDDLNPYHQSGFSLLIGLSQEARQHYDLAVQSYQESLANWPTVNPTAQTELQQHWLLIRLAHCTYQHAKGQATSRSDPLWELARRYLELSLDSLENLHWQDPRPDSLTRIAEILIAQENWEPLRRLGEHLLIFYYQIQPTGDAEASPDYPYWTIPRLTRTITLSYAYMAEALIGQWRFPEALEALQQAQDLLKRLGKNLGRLSGKIYYLLGRAQLGEGHLPQALQALELAYQEAEQTENLSQCLTVLIELRECYRQKGDILRCLGIDQQYQGIEYLLGTKRFVGVHPRFPLGTVVLEDYPSLQPLWDWWQQPEMTLFLLVGAAKQGKSSYLAIFTALLDMAPGYCLKSWPQPLPTLSRDCPWDWVILDLGSVFASLLLQPTAEVSLWPWLATLLTLGRSPESPRSPKVMISLRPDEVPLFLHHLTLAFPADALPPLTYFSLPLLNETEINSAFALAQESPQWLEPSLWQTVLQELQESAPGIHPLELQILGSELENQRIITLEHYVAPGKKRFLQAYIQRIVAIAEPDEQMLIRSCLARLCEGISPSLLTFERLLEQVTTPREVTLTGEALTRILTFLQRAGLTKSVIIDQQRYYQLLTPAIAQAVHDLNFTPPPVTAKITTSHNIAFKSLELAQQIQAPNLEIAPAERNALQELQHQSQQLINALKLERHCSVILKQFETHPLDSLIAALHCAQPLYQSPTQTWEDYESLAPIYTLQFILSQIYERNRLQHRLAVTHLALSPDGDFAVTGAADHNLRLWTLTGKKMATLRGHQANITDIQWHPSSEYMLSGAADHTAKLWSKWGQILTTFRGHEDWVRSVAFHPSLDCIATASRDGTIKFWRQDGELINTLRGHQGAIRQIVFSANGQLLLSASRDKTARLWSLEGQELVCFQGHQGWVRTAQFSPDGHQVLTASVDGSARIWSLDGKPQGLLRGHQGGLRTASFSPDGQQIVTASLDGTARLWDAQGKQQAVLQGHGHTVYEAQFSHDSYLVATTGGDHTIRIWNRQGKALVVLRGHQKEVFLGQFHPNSRLLVSISADHTARLWDLTDKGTVILRGHQHWVRSVHTSLVKESFGKIHLHILTASRDKTARLWNSTGQCVQILEGHQGWVREARFSPDGRLIATASADMTVQIWNLLGVKLATFKGHQDSVLTVRFSGNGQYLLTASRDKTAKIWNISGQCLTTLRQHNTAVFCAEFSSDGQFIVTATGDGTVKLWDIVGREMATCAGHDKAVYSVQFSLDSRWLLTASGDRTARLWNMLGKEIAVLKGHQGIVYQAQFSPDEQLIATASEDQTARLWDRKGQELAVLYGHQGLVSTVQWSRDGQLLVTASEDGTARVWDRAGRELALLQGHHNWVRMADFTPDSQWVVTASTDGTARLWPLTRLETLLERGYEWVKDYLRHNPLVKDSDRQLLA